MAVRTALLLALCLLCGAAVARPDGDDVIVRKAKPGEGKDAVRVKLPSTPTPTQSGAVDKVTRTETAVSKGASAATAYSLTIKVYCYCYYSCYFPYKYVDKYYSTRSGTRTLSYGYYLTFSANSDYYYYVNNKKYDPVRTNKIALYC